MDPIFAAIVDVGVQVALEGFDPLQLSFHKSPLNVIATMVGPARLVLDDKP
jgi:hypothetical protein